MSDRVAIVSGTRKDGVKYRAAKSLVKLYDQHKAVFSKKKKTALDATIGDAAHAARTSDHNPNSAGVVTALDLQHDPDNGFDAHKFADLLKQTKDERIKYVISNKRIFYGPRSPQHGANPASLWKWGTYSQSNPHIAHIHVSVADNRFYDLEKPWNVGDVAAPPPPPVVSDRPELELGSKGEDVEVLQGMLFVDGIFGKVTEKAVKDFQIACGLDPDGIVGPDTWAALEASEEPSTPQPVLPSQEAIIQIASDSDIADYNWRGRGKAPAGYTKGFALAWANVVRKFHEGDSSVLEMAKADTLDDTTDALSWYRSNFRAIGLNNSEAGIDTLRHLFVLLMGLGMRESSGKFCTGRDTSASNVDSDTTEAGLMQTSYNAHASSDEFHKLIENYDRDCFLDVFREGVSCTASDLQSHGAGPGLEFQRKCKTCPPFAIETAGIVLRNLRKHYGPINRKEVEIRPEADEMLMAVQEFVTTPVAEQENKKSITAVEPIKVPAKQENKMSSDVWVVFLRQIMMIGGSALATKFGIDAVALGNAVDLVIAAAMACIPAAAAIWALYVRKGTVAVPVATGARSDVPTVSAVTGLEEPATTKRTGPLERK